MKRLLCIAIILLSLTSFSQTNPCITPKYRTIYVNSNAENGAILDTIRACDPDAGTVIKWAITAGNTSYSAFKLVPINALMCQFVLANKNALPVYSTFSITVRGTDNGIPAKYATHVFTVLKKDPLPVICFSQPATDTLRIPVTTLNNVAIDTLWQCNQDGTAYSNVTWAIKSGNTNYSAFKLVTLDSAKTSLVVANKNAFIYYTSFKLSIRGTYTGTTSFFTRTIIIILTP